MRLRLASRGSALALAQASLAERALLQAGAEEIETIVVRTTGDDVLVPAAAMTGQGWFTSELEALLTRGGADVGAHSAKDLPGDLADGLTVAAHLQRADPRDALVLPGEAEAMADVRAWLSEPRRVGTSSPRRAAALTALATAPLQIIEVRGNVDTRLRRLDEGVVDGLLLACAGLDRLGLSHRATVRLDPALMMPSPGQGAVALECAEHGPAHVLVSAADHAQTTAAVMAERTVLRALGGGCRLPLGALAESARPGWLRLRASLGLAESRTARAEAEGAADDPARLGMIVAAELRRAAA